MANLLTPNLTDYLTSKQAAASLGVLPGTLSSWDRAKEIQPHRHPIRRYRLFNPQALEELLQQIRGSAKPPTRKDFREH